MKTIRFVVPLICAASFASADISGTTNISSGTSYSLDKGTTVTSGADFIFTGTSINLQGSALAFSVGAAGSTAFGAITATTAPFLTYSATTISGSSLVANEVFVVHTNGGNYGKVLITAVSASQLIFQYTTFGVTGGGGGNIPTITGVSNNYSSIPAGFPNYGIAPGSLFFIKGTALGTSTTDLQSSASPGLQNTVAGVSVSVVVGGTTVNCPIYYVSPTQVDAVLPNNTPTGAATITVTSNNVPSATFSTVVVQSAFGIINYNGTLGAVYDGSSLITATNSANPGQTITIYGSGIGADANNDGKLFPQNSNNLTNIPTQVFVGGVSANVLYRGRTQFPGVDQINITIPSSVPTGCYVSLTVVSGSTPIVSNGTTIPVAASGKTCSDTNSIFSPTLIQTLSGKGTVRTGLLQVSQTTGIGAGNNTVSNFLVGAFVSVTGTSYAGNVGNNQVSNGSCVVANPVATNIPTTTSLDAGPTINVSGPQGSIGLAPLTLPIAIQGLPTRVYAASTVSSSFIPPTGGPFTFDNVNGGADVGHFNSTVNSPASFAWTNSATVTSVNRSQGLTVTWSGGTPGVIVTISGNSSAQINGQTVSGSFTCQAPLSAGQFTVPPSILLALPSGGGQLSLLDYTPPQLFTASGIDVGFIQASTSFNENVQYN